MTIYQRLGDQSRAESAAADALVAAPGLASDAGWQTVELRDTFEAALPLAFERAEPSIGFRIAMEAGRAAEAEKIAATLPSEERPFAQAAVRAWFGDRAAFNELHRMAAGNPLHNIHVAICRRVAARSREPGWPYGWSGDCNGTRPSQYPAIRAGPPVAGPATLPGPNATWHIHFVYRRHGPDDELAPGIPHLWSDFGS